VISDHAKREIKLLTRLSEDTALPPLTRAMALLIAHQRFDAGPCLCGWYELGKPHAEHQALELERAGLLITQEEKP
jgi:hypothetical protein